MLTASSLGLLPAHHCADRISAYRRRTELSCSRARSRPAPQQFAPSVLHDGFKELSGSHRLSAESRRVKTADIRVSNSDLGRAVADAIAEKVFGGSAKVSKDPIYGWQVAGDNFSFDIEVDDGSVTLDGEAPSPTKARAAIRHARLVPGVRSVHSMLYLESYGHGRFSFAKDYPDVPYYYWPY